MVSYDQTGGVPDELPDESRPRRKQRVRRGYGHTGRGRDWRKKDLTGKRFGSLVVVEDADIRIGEHVVWVCRCDCGGETEVCSNNLISGNTKSCGCRAKVEPAEEGKE